MKIKWGHVLDPQWRKYLGREWRRTDENEHQVRIPDRYWSSVLEIAGMQGCRALSTPSEVNPEHMEEGDVLDDERRWRYRSILGKEIWTIPERPDTAFTVKELSRLLSNANEKHLLHYLQGTRKVYLRLRGGYERENEIS
eukprot:5017986-Heterocapsa_arctica.AAC.1